MSAPPLPLLPPAMWTRVFVHKTDAAISKQVKIAYEVPRADGPDIRYPMALVEGSPKPGAAKKFLDYLASEEAGQIFTQYGFLLRQ